MNIRALLLLIILPAALFHAIGQAQPTPLLAPTPPMGWNSWDSFGLTVNQREVKRNAAWMAKYLKRYGWQYVVIDEGWYLANPESKGKSPFHYTLDQHGRYQPAPNRFPSASDRAGFKPLADYVHSLGLRFGIHIIRGIPREAVDRNLPIAGSKFRAAEAADRSDLCAWNHDNYGLKPNAAGQAYYDSLAKLYASWGVDFIKVDCISHPYKAAQIAMISKALRKTGRPIVLSLSPGPTPLDEAKNVRQYAQMWRISGDMWDTWKAVHAHFALTAHWAPYVEAGHWPNADMLPIGRLAPLPPRGAARQTNLTHDEQQTLLNLWAIFRSPLIMGGNLVLSDAWTDSLLTNSEWIAVDQHSIDGRPVISTPDTIVWTAKPDQGSGFYVAVFNVSGHPENIRYPWQALKFPAAKYAIRNLWTHQNLGPAQSLQVALRPHASVLYRLTGTER